MWSAQWKGSTSVLTAVLERQVRENPDRVALISQRESISYKELLGLSRRCCEYYRSIDLRAGYRVAMMVSNSVEDAIALLGLEMSGVDTLLLDPRATTAEHDRLNREFGTNFCIDGKTGMLLGVMGGKVARSRAGRSCFALATSGMGGEPKVVCRDWAASVANASAFANAAGYAPGTETLCTTPLHHSYALGATFLASLVAGASLVLIPTPVLPSTILSIVSQRRITVLQSIPFLFRQVLKIEGERPVCLRLCLSAGEPLDSDLGDRWETRFGVPLSDHYGTTETGNISIELGGVVGSVGRPIAGVQVRVVPELATTNHDLGMSGELVVKVAGRSSSYCGQSARSRSDFRRSWFYTGDIGRIGLDGRIFLESRLSERVNIAGNKVDPGEVERAIGAFPGVIECAVCGFARNPSGDELWAFVVAVHNLHLLELRRFLAQVLSGYKIPTVFRQVKELPKTSSGKIRRGLLRDHALSAGASSGFVPDTPSGE